MKRFSSLVLGASVLACVFSCQSQSRTSTPGPADPEAPSEFTTTESGLKYRILRKSEGRKPIASDAVTVDYVGWIESRREFDNSYNRREPSKFPLSDVIPGWTEGLQLVAEGGMIELEIPPELGYGREGRPGSIPPDATLHFRIELHEIHPVAGSR